MLELSRWLGGLGGLAVGARRCAWLGRRAAASGAGAARAERQALRARLAAAETRGDELAKQLTPARPRDRRPARRALDAEQHAARAGGDARWEAARQSVEEQRRLLDEARDRLTETFKALSVDALRESNTSFLELADGRSTPARAARGGHRRPACSPLKDALQRGTRSRCASWRPARQHAYGTPRGAAARARRHAASELQRETRQPRHRAARARRRAGRWGEITLHRVVELAGMTEHCDFDEQVHRRGRRAAALRPDMVVHLPDGREIVVDAKVPLSRLPRGAGGAAAGGARRPRSRATRSRCAST